MFGGDTDPWTNVVYNNDTLGIEVFVGLNTYQIKARTLIFHDRSGARIACGTILSSFLVEDTPIFSEFTPYPGYSGNMTVTGTVVTHFPANPAPLALLAYQIEADPDCLSGASLGNT